MAWRNRFKHRKELKKYRKSNISNELKFLAWSPTRWWDWCLPEDENKGIELISTDKN